LVGPALECGKELILAVDRWIAGESKK
jgi:hypothetical protein